MSFIDLVKSRYSCRAFDARPVENEKLQQILEAGRLAPTAKNGQPIKIFVLKSAEALEKVRNVTRMAYIAPVVLAICYDQMQSYRALNYNDDHDCGDMDASIVTTTMMMEATDLGLNTLWARGFNAIEVARALEIPENLKLACLLDVGYADAELGAPSPRHTQRKEMSEIVVEK